jgi:hypothetical protein
MKQQRIRHELADAQPALIRALTPGSGATALGSVRACSSQTDPLPIPSIHQNVFAALPPDVRKVYDLPDRVIKSWGYAPQYWGAAP